MVNKGLTRRRSCWRNEFDRVVWCREKRSGAGAGSAAARGSWRASIQDLSIWFAAEVPPGWGRQPEVKWPAAPSLPTTSNCPASSRAMASIDSNGEAASGSRKIGVGFTTTLLRKRGGLERIADSDVASPRKGLGHGKFSSFYTVEQLLRAGGGRHAPTVAIAGHALMSGSSTTRGNRSCAAP
jgi:hypothetical protein